MNQKRWAELIITTVCFFAFGTFVGALLAHPYGHEPVAVTTTTVIYPTAVAPTSTTTAPVPTTQRRTSITTLRPRTTTTTRPTTRPTTTTTTTAGDAMGEPVNVTVCDTDPSACAPSPGE